MGLGAVVLFILQLPSQRQVTRRDFYIVCKYSNVFSLIRTSVILKEVVNTFVPMALAGKYSPQVQAYINKMKETDPNYGSRITTTQRTKDTPNTSNRFSQRPPASRLYASSSQAPSPSQNLFGKDSFSGLDAPPPTSNREEADRLIANAIAVGRARNNVKPGTEYDLGGLPAGY